MNVPSVKPLRRIVPCLALFLACALAQNAPIAAQPNPATDRFLPRIVEKDGRYALLVDGSPYLMLGAQVNNSSAWPSMLPKVWPAIEYMHANTVEMPIYWEQFEPEQGRFDYSVMDTLLSQARAHHVRLILLWFGTWKNGSPHYMPGWMKAAPDRYPRLIGADGHPVDSASPYGAETLKADIAAFTALMRHLKTVDPQHTVIMVQVENEPGTYGSVRDHSPAAQKAFEAPVPRELLTGLHKEAAPSANWQSVFGADAEEFFHAWSVAHYIEQVAAAGKAVYPLPMYVNVALRDPLHPGPPSTYESGGATDNVIPIWKAAAPSIVLLAPDIYVDVDQNEAYRKALDLYHRPDNPMFVPETRNNPEIARYLFVALDHGTIGFSPFGMDYTGYSNSPLGVKKMTEESMAPYAMNYKLLGPIDREIARLDFDGKLHAVAEEKSEHSQKMQFGAWTVTVSYGLGEFFSSDDPPGNPEPVGRALVAELGDNQFLVTGFFCRVDFNLTDTASGKQRQYLRVEEGTYEGGTFHPIRIWNGDQTDWGLNFTQLPQVLRVSVGTY